MGSSSKAESKTARGKASRSDRLADHVCLFLDCQTTGASVATGGNLLEVAWCEGSASAAVSLDAIRSSAESFDGSRFEVTHSNADRMYVELSALSNLVREHSERYNAGSGVQSFLVKQPDELSIPMRIQMLTGITDDAMIAAIDSNEIARHLLKASNKVSQPQLCVIHYARFEAGFLTHLMDEHGEQWPFQNICTFEIARRLYPNLPSRGIRALGGFLGFDMEEVKRSNSHVEATRVIWGHLVERLAEAGVVTIEQLQEFLSTKAGARSGPLEYKMERLKRLDLPGCPGVYRMLNQSGRVLYVGKATSLKSRVNSHFRGRKKKTSKSKELLTQVAEIEVTECGSPLEAALLETDEIKRFDPPYNISLKQRNRYLLFASRDFLSFAQQQDEIHTIGPLPNLRALDALLRLSVTINSGIVDPHVLFVEIPVENLQEGVDVFLERHEISMEDGITPRSLLALGLRMFRTTRRLLRQLAIDEAKAQCAASEVGDHANEFSEDSQSLNTLREEVKALGVNLDELGEVDDLGEDDDELEVGVDDLTPAEIATKFESLLIGVARTYLASKELTSLLNCNIRFQYKKVQREIAVCHGRVLTEPMTASERKRWDTVKNSNCHWAKLDVRDYDRMRVLLTEVTKMMTAQKEIQIEPSLVLLSRW